MNTRAVFIVLGAVLLFLAGWGASDIIRAKHLVIVTDRDEARVTIGTDSMGNGHLVIKDWQGNTTFEVRGSTVIMPAGAGASTTSSMPAAAASPARVMRVVVVETITGDVEKSDRAQTLRTETVDLELAADEKAKEARDLTVPSNSPYRDRYGRITDRRAHETWMKDKTLEVRRKRQALNAEVAKLLSTAKRKRRQADTLEKEAREPRQGIIGRRGGQDILLHADRDLTKHMAGVNAGVCITWTGKLVASDGFSETWSVRSIKVVACP